MQPICNTPQWATVLGMCNVAKENRFLRPYTIMQIKVIYDILDEVI